MAGQLSIEMTGSFGDYLKSLQDAGTVTEREAKRMQSQLTGISKFLQDIEKGQKAAGAAAAEMEKAAKGAENFGFHTAGAKRELLVLTHELSQGNYSRFGGSLLVLAERTNAMELAFSAAGLGAGLLVGAIAGVAAAAIKGAHEQDVFNRSLILTGNYAGQTAASFDALAHAIAASSNSTVGTSKEALQALVSSGVFGPSLLKDAGQAVVTLSHLTGQTTEEVVRDFARMQDGATKWAEEHNKTMHFLSAAQFEYIRSLEQQGDSEKAEQVVLEALNAKLSASEQNVGTLAKAWMAVKAAASEAVEAMSKIGTAPTSADQISSLRAKLNSMRNLPGDDTYSSYRQHTVTVAQERALIESQIRAIQDRENAQHAAALKAAADAQIQEKAIEGSKVVERINEEVNNRAKATKEIKEYTAAVKAMRAANSPDAPTPKQEAATVAALREKHRDKGAVKLENSYTSKFEQLGGEQIKLQTQIANWQKYGKAIDDSALATLNLEIAQGKLKGIPDAERKRLVDLATSVDDLRKKFGLLQSDTALQKSLREQTVSIDKEIASIKMQTAMIGMSSIERQKAADMIKVQAEAEKLIAANVGKEGEINAWAADQVKKLTKAHQAAYDSSREFSAGARKAIADYQESSTNAAKYAENMISGSFSRMEDALVKFARTGKLQFSDLFNYMADEFLRQQARMMVSQGATSLLGFLGPSFLSAHTGIATGVANAMPGDSLDNLVNITGGFGTIPGHANGLDYVPYDNYVARLHEGERVLTKQQAKSQTGQTVNVYQTNHIGAGVNRAEMMAALARVRETTKADVLASLNHNGVFGRRTT